MIYKPYYYNEEKWYSLEDLLNYQADATSPRPQVEPYGSVSIMSCISTQFGINHQRMYIFEDGQGGSFRLKQYINELGYYLTARYFSHYCFREEAEKGSSKWRSTYREFLNKIVSILTFTYDKYSSMLNFYATEKSKLMDKIQAVGSGITRFNDTPQDEGTFDDDEHTTNLTQVSSTSSSDGDTKIKRLNEIDKLFNNLLLEWCNEFDKLFVEEINL